MSEQGVSLLPRRRRSAAAQSAPAAAAAAAAADSKEQCQKIVPENSAKDVVITQEPLPQQLQQQPPCAALPGEAEAPPPPPMRFASKVSNDKGYCMARTCFGLSEGSCYCEVEILEPQPAAFSGTQPHCRLGFSTARGDIEAPAGYDWFGFCYRDLDGAAYHQSVRQRYGAPYGVGDCVGMLIRLPPLPPPADGRYALPEDKLWKLDERFVPTRKCPTHTIPGSCATDRMRTVEWLQVHPGSSIEFFVNGKSQGVAFTDIPQGTYYPTVSLYMGATVRVRFGPDDFKFMTPQQLQEHNLPPAGLIRPPARQPAPKVVLKLPAEAPAVPAFPAFPAAAAATASLAPAAPAAEEQQATGGGQE